jgi:hypothetical protein
VTRADLLLSFFDVFASPDKPPSSCRKEVWPTGLAPFIRRAEDGSGNWRVEVGHFGRVPSFAKELAFGRRGLIQSALLARAASALRIAATSNCAECSSQRLQVRRQLVERRERRGNAPVTPHPYRPAQFGPNEDF